jgi:alcohol dehydrogenase (cytochrome c)
MGEESYSMLKGIEATTGRVVWEHRMQTRAFSPVMSTVTGLVFAGTMEGDYYALDAKTGEQLWSFPGGLRVQGGGVTFLVEGKQRIVVPIGNSLVCFGL